MDGFCSILVILRNSKMLSGKQFVSVNVHISGEHLETYFLWRPYFYKNRL